MNMVDGEPEKHNTFADSVRWQWHNDKSQAPTTVAATPAEWPAALHT